MMEESSMGSIDHEIENEFPGKNKFVSIGIILTVVSAAMAIGSIVLLFVMLQTAIHEVFLTLFHHFLDKDTLSVFRVLVGIMILLSIIQLIANISFTSSAIMGKPDQIYRFNSRYTIVNSLAGCACWVLVMSIMGTCSHGHIGTLFWAAVFLGGTLHSSTIFFLFVCVETQKKDQIEGAKLVDDREDVMTKSYMKFDNPHVVL